MRNWTEATDAELGAIRGVCLDIDDTLSTRGKLTAQAYAALWDLKNAGFEVVPITGRPAGWCDHFARFWPVDAIVGENGAFTYFMEGGVRREVATPGAESDEALRRARLDGLAKTIHSKFPHARWASDQAFRAHDLAVDICEDVRAWPREEVDALLQLCADSGAHAKLSSIHVNAWFGEYDKIAGFRHWLGIRKGAKTSEDSWLFIGDSPNDEPLFKGFRNSVGVANLARYRDRLRHPPRWITAAESGAGFAEMATRLVKLRSHIKP